MVKIRENFSDILKNVFFFFEKKYLRKFKIQKFLFLNIPNMQN
jgi:hypothetical protein